VQRCAGLVAVGLVAVVAACGSGSKHSATTPSTTTPRPGRYATIAKARTAVDFPVPDPGTHLDQARLTRIVVGSSHFASGPGTTVTFFYSGGGIEGATVEVGPPNTGFGRAIASSLEHDVGPRLVGPHFSAESEDDSYAFRCGDVMVFVSMYEPSPSRWKRLLTRVARDCPEKR